MSPILLWMLIAIFGFGLITVGEYFYSAKCIELLYTRDKEDLEYILDTECVPARWCKKYVRRVERMKERGASEARIERVRVRANNYYCRRMKRIESFAASDSYLQYNKTAKVVTQRRLEDIHTQWERREYLHEPY